MLKILMFRIPEVLIRDNAENLAGCEVYGCEYVLIDGEYFPNIVI